MHVFPYSPYLNGKIREVVSDCALPISVVIFSFIGSYLFLDIQRKYRPLTNERADRRGAPGRLQVTTLAQNSLYGL